MPPKWLAPTEAEIQEDVLGRVHPCCARLGIPDALRDAIGARLGVQKDFSVQFLAPLTDAERIEFMENVALLIAEGDARQPTLFEKAQVRSLFQLADIVASKMVGQAQQAPPQPQAQAQAPRQAQAQAAQNARKIKVSDVLGPMDECLIDPLTPGELNAFFDNYRELKHGDPQEEAEPTLEQVSAFNARVVTLQLASYGDFSILTPLGRRMAKVLEHRAWLPNRDGTHRTVEVPGPDSYDVWYACWRVFAGCCLMLRWPQAVGGSTVVATPAALEYYQETFRQLAFDYAECWFLCCKAEDACRAEHLARIRRRMMVQNNGVPVPCSDVFIAAADDPKFWDKEVRRLDMLYLARGRNGGEPTAAYEEDPTGITAKVSAQLHGGKRALEPPFADSSAPKRGRNTRSEKKAAGASSAGGGSAQGPQASQSRGHGSQGGGHPKMQNGKYITSREGIEICFTFSKNARDACAEPFRNNRAHICQICLGPHRNEECSRANNQGKGGGGKGGKGK